jgi:hypothetical protein
MIMNTKKCQKRYEKIGNAIDKEEREEEGEIAIKSERNTTRKCVRVRRSFLARTSNCILVSRDQFLVLKA